MASVRMSLQDIQITEGSKKLLTACVLFDNGGQVALVCNKLCKRAGFKSQRASYTLAGVGGLTQVYTPENRGCIWMDNDGVVETIQAYGVPKILLDTIWHCPLKSYRKKFPEVSARVSAGQGTRSTHWQHLPRAAS